MPFRYANLKGRRFKRWTVLDLYEIRKGNARWLCICDCGAEKVVSAACLIDGSSKSCGCLARELSAQRGKERLTTHGMSRTRFNGVWRDIIDRCTNPKSSSYKYYGGRGICIKWKSFEEFKADMHESYLEHKKNNASTTIERVDNNGNYSKENCIWVTQAEQMKNRRKGNQYVQCNNLRSW